jgi:uncharacterized protein (DUF697 family)/predicted GTPase
MWEKVRHLLSRRENDAQLGRALDNLRKHTAVPVFWLYGKTQSGKTSVIRFLTGNDDAEIGHGFKPCTRYSRQYDFPTAEARLLKFLDTRGLDEPGYDPDEDIARFNDSAHMLIVTVKALDHAQEHVLRHLRALRLARPSRPVLLLLTCLHEAYPQKQHPQPYAFGSGAGLSEPPVGVNSQNTTLERSLTEQRRRFAGLVDRVVPVDFTRPEEGFADPAYGGHEFKRTLLELLPEAYRQTLLTLDVAKRELGDLFSRRVLPHIIGYSMLATTAGAVPIPLVDLLILPGIQSQMIYHLARVYGQPLSASRFLELAGTLGLGIALRQAAREVVKLIPYVGSVIGGAVAGTSTFALGKAFCFYYSAVFHGQVPKADDLRRYYHEQLTVAEKFLKPRKTTVENGA